MKVNEFIKKNRDLVIIYSLAVIESIFLIVFRGVFSNNPDAPSYINAFDVLMSGQLDSYRTPVYPFVLGTMKLLAGENSFLMATVVFQHLMFLLSIWFFYQTALRLKISPKVVFWMTLFYGCFPYLNVWANRIITESLAISWSVILIYCCTVLLTNEKSDKPSRRETIHYGASFCLIFIILLFHRPIFIYLVPVFLLVFGLKAAMKSGRHFAIAGMVATVATMLCLLLYMNEFRKEYGVFSVSEVSSHNNYANAIIDGLIDNPDSSGFWEMNPKEMKDYMDGVYKSHPKEAVVAIFHRFFRAADFQLLFYRGTQDHLWINVGWIYLFLLVYIMMLVAWMIRKKTIAWVSITLWVLCVSNIIVAVVGANDEYNRLILPSMPFVLLMLGQVISPFTKESIDKIAFQ
ncbi:MAG: hypothetical protein K5651_09170 [Bacteroidales bacterium]|nr:hypothetical protein [Bacteroidales bacterium]